MLAHPAAFRLRSLGALLTKRHLIQPPSSATISLVEELGEVASSPSGAESLARELSPLAVQDLQAALVRVQTNSTTPPVPLTSRQKLYLSLESGLPFVGFGFIDNSGMLIFGDQIDMSLGVTFSLSALSSAALGNMMSDVLGISLGSTIAAWTSRLGLPAAHLTLEQTLSRSARRWRQFGSTIGVIIGCLLGMFPLLFIDSNKTERLKKRKMFEDLFGAAIAFIASPEALDSESATLFVVDRPKSELWTLASKDLSTKIRIPLNAGLVGLSATTGQAVNVRDASKHPAFSPVIDEQTGVTTKSLLCSPILDRAGNVIGVVEVINKRGGSVFSLDDERSLSAISAHLAVVLAEATATGQTESHLLDQLHASVSHSKAHVRFNSQRQPSRNEHHSSSSWWRR